jgi:hypothetical protein
MHGSEAAGSLDELDQLRPIRLSPLDPVGTGESRGNVRGSPRLSRFSTGADADDEGLGVGEADSNHVGVNGEGGGRGTRG